MISTTLGIALSACASTAKDSTSSENLLSDAVLERDAHARLDDLGVQGAAIRNNANQRAAFIEDLRRTRALAAQAVADGLDATPQFKQRLESQRENILAGLYLEKQFALHANEAAQRAFFEKNRERFSRPQRSAFHIVTKSEASARAAIDALRKPRAKRTEILKAFAPSTPDGVSSGNLGTFTRGQMLKPIDDVVFSTPVGEVHPNPVRTVHGWHAIEVTSEIVPKLVTFEDVRAEVENDLKSELHRRIVQDAIKARNPQEAAR
jgi:parvulin-like peptidyl-prolyl isomerase